MKENIESLWKIYNAVNEWIKFSDTKAAVVLATNGVVLSIFFSNILKYIKPLFLYQVLTSFVILFIIIGTVAGILSIIYAIFCLIPDTGSYKSKSLVFFGDIAQFDTPEEYSKEAKKELFNELNLKDHIFQEIWINSRIASDKYDNVKLSIKLLGIAVLFLIISFVICIFINMIGGVNFGN